MSLTKNDLLEKIQSGHEQFLTLLAVFNPEQLVKPGIIGKWSVKDITAHIAVHEKRMLEWMAEKLRGGNPSAFQPFAMPEVDLAVVNERIYQENRRREWLDVLRELQNVHHQTLVFVKTAGEEDLMTTRRYHLLDGKPLWMAVAANTFEHREEHSRDIRAWMTGKPKQGQ